MKVLPPIALTGATGFVGRTVVAEAKKKSGLSLRALVRKSSSAQTDSIQGSLEDPGSLTKLVEGCDTVLHIAGAINSPDRAGFFRANVEGTLNLLKASQASSVKRFVFISSLVAREPSLSDYAASKAEAERILKQSAHGLQVLILRPPAVYGEGDMATLPLIKSLLGRVAVVPGSGASRFSLIHVCDLARICIEAALGSEIGTLELDDGHRGYGWDDLAEITRRHFGRPQKLVYLPRSLALAVASFGNLGQRAFGVPAMLTKAKVNELYHADWCATEPGWPSPADLTLEQGLLQTIAWYREHGHLRTEDKAPKRNQY
jgi:nucleoside-diphosphate-sugar epimerase